MRNRTIDILQAEKMRDQIDVEAENRPSTYTFKAKM